MAEPVTPQPSEGETTPSSSGQPNYIARSMLRIMRRTEQSLSPWSRRMLNTPSLVQRQAGEAPSAASGPVARSPFTALNTSSAISRRAAQPLVQRVQNIVAKSSQIQRSAEPGMALSLNRFSSAVINRFPEKASRYQAPAADSSEVVQRAPLPFVGGGDSSPSESPSSVNVPTSADVEMAALRNSGDEAFYPQVTPQDSVASQLSERLQAFREPGSAASPAPSPRQISRMTADRVSRRTDSSAPIRRSTIEEVDPKSSSLPSLTPPSAPTVQRQPAAPSAQPIQRQAQPPSAPAVQRSPEAPTTPSQPTIQRKPASFASDEPALESSPTMPSLTQQLLQRFQTGRDKWENPASASDSPATPLTPSATPPAVQRTPDAAPPATPAAPPVITEHHSRPVRRAAQPPAVQRQASPAPAVETPAPSVTPTVESPSVPTVQRQAETSTSTPSEPAAPVDSAPVVTPASPTVQRKPAETVATPSPAPIQRSVTNDTQTSEATTPAIQRTPDSTPTIQRSPAESVTVPTPASTPSTAPIQRSPALPEDVPSPASTPSVAPVQRSVSGDAPAPTPVTAVPPAVQRTSDDLPLHPPSTPTASVPAAPVSMPPVSTQPAVPTSASAPASAPASIQRSPESAPSTSQPAAQPSSPAASTQTVQRQPAVAQPSALASQPVAAVPTPAAPSIQRTASESIQTSMPLARPPSQPLQPAMAVTVQRAPAALAEESPMAVAVREPAVTAQVARKPMAVVQRQSAGTASQTVDISRANLPLAKAAPAPTVTTKVQRALTEASSDFESAPDDARDKAEVRAPSREALANLAKQIYPMLKRMLAVERERR